MKTNQLLTTLLLAGGIFTINAQNVASTANLTSGGNSAGTGGVQSVYYGATAGNSSTSSSSNNTFIGHASGMTNISGRSNLYAGARTGGNITTGSDNVMLGTYAGQFIPSGSNNVLVGTLAGGQVGQTVLVTDKSNNTCIGYYAGTSSLGGSNNVFIGYRAGQDSTGNSKLFIDNTGTATPLIWGDFALDQVKLNGKVGIGGVTAFPTTAGGANLSTYDLFVKGGILAEEVRVATTWADYVFANDYALLTLEEVELFISNNGHLPNVPSAKQVAEEGISLGDIARIQQEKIEELTLYIIEQNKQLQAQQLINEQFKKQENEIRELKALVQNLVEKK
ncbi:hypothetical protein [Flavobacterium cerinum]|uniref:SlyX family protein n=1 Tax=Flavobacterium cerinum TaxID=2502784 RepID=A0A444HDY7_9FLAO|nr:hypothetical protein [Flavobacterium cerinum]RWX02455.1 hypothetical protein EPI11_04345 [Flavobacterium cerinum]